MTNAKRHISGRPLLALGLIALATGRYFAERMGSGIWNTWTHSLGLVLLVWYLWLLLRDHRSVVLTSFYHIYYSLGMLLSAAIISAGAYMIEVSEYGTSNGFFWVMMIYFVTGMETTRLGYAAATRGRFGPGTRQLSKGIKRLALLLMVGGTLALAAYVFLLTGGPLLRGVDRVTFWRTIAPAGTSLLPSIMAQSFFFAAFYYLWQRRSRRKLLFPTTILVIYILTTIFVLGQKFSAFILFINTWLLILPGIFPDFRFRARHIVMLAAIAAVILLYTVATYLLEGKDASFLITRAALQAQLLWSVFNEPDALSLLPREPACYFSCGEFVSGMDYITYRYLPEGLYNFYAEGGTVLSGFMPALSILSFGFGMSLLIHLTISFILGFTQRKAVVSFANGSLIYGFLLSKVQFAITMIWFAAMNTALRGLLFTLALLIVYRMVFSTEAKMARLSGQPFADRNLQTER